MSVKKYVKKPVVIEALVFEDTVDCLAELSDFMNNQNVKVSYVEPEPKLLIETLEGTMSATEGDYIIKGISGEFYPCKPDIFHKTYEEVEENEKY